MKSILFNFKESYAVLSTILILMFSSLYIDNPVFSLSMGSEFYFIYKSYSYFLLFISLALFFMFLNNQSKKYYEIRKFSILKKFKFLILGAILLVLSFMTYMFPLLIGLVFLFLHCIFSERSRKLVNFNLFISFLLFVIITYVIFDTLLQYYLSYIIIKNFFHFFKYELLITIYEIVPHQIIIYTILLILFLILFFLKFLLFKILKNKENQIIKRRKRLKIVGKLIIIIFILF